FARHPVTGFVEPLLDPGQIANGAARSPASPRFSHSALTQELGLQIHMGLEFGPEILRSALSPQPPRHDLLPSGLEHTPDGAAQPSPFRGLFRQPLPSLSRQAIEPRPAVVLRQAPARRHPATILQTLQRWIQRSVLDQQLLARGLLDRARDALPVLLAQD